MRKSLVLALCFSAALAVSQSEKPAKQRAAKAAKPGAAPAIGSLKCEALPPVFRSDSSSKVIQEKIGPDEGSPTGNSFFMINPPAKYLVVRLTPTTSDSAAYPVKIITRYTDDTIFEPVMEAIVPQAGVPFVWGPLEVRPAEVPRDKVGDIVMVKVQENYALQPDAKGFSYTLSVEGCN